MSRHRRSEETTLIWVTCEKMMCKNMKIVILNCLACFKQPDWQKNISVKESRLSNYCVFVFTLFNHSCSLLYFCLVCNVSHWRQDIAFAAALVNVGNNVQVFVIRSASLYYQYTGYNVQPTIFGPHIDHDGYISVWHVSPDHWPHIHGPLTS